MLLAQTSVTKYVVLSPKSNIDAVIISEGLAKSCPTVEVTEEPSKANYVLEASKTTTHSEDDSHSLWHFALFNKDGDLLMATHFTRRSKFHFESVRKYITAKAGQHNSSLQQGVRPELSRHREGFHVQVAVDECCTTRVKTFAARWRLAMYAKGRVTQATSLVCHVVCIRQ